MIDQPSVKIQIRQDLHAIWFDTIHVAAMREKGSDNSMMIMYLCQGLPGIDSKERIEVARLITSRQHAERTIDVLCRVMKYYPDKPADPPKPSGA